MSNLRANLSDRAMPKLCTATHIGKIDWNISGWAVEKADDEKYVWLRTPYTLEYIESFAPILNFQDNVRVNKEGTLDNKYWLSVGDDELMLGSREPLTLETVHHKQQDITEYKDYQINDDLIYLKNYSLSNQISELSVVPTNHEGIYRAHKAIVEVNITNEEIIDAAINYISENKEITDVILSAEDDIIDNFYQVDIFVKALRDIQHINAVRLRSFKFNYQPQKYTSAILNNLRTLNKLSINNPKRLEIETQFIHGSEITDQHLEIASILRNRGITVYNNTPMLSFINDTPEEIWNLSYKLRKIGIEFHQLYIAGLKIQQEWNSDNPITTSNVINIASFLRQKDSGRTIPMYVVRTPLGDVDLNISSNYNVVDEDNQLILRLPELNKEHFTSFAKDFNIPQDIDIDEDGGPKVPVNNLKHFNIFS
jgi:lysine 2,3-aminomutase